MGNVIIPANQLEDWKQQLEQLHNSIASDIALYEKAIEETQSQIRASYEQGQTNVDWAREKILVNKAKRDALKRLLV